MRGTSARPSTGCIKYFIRLDYFSMLAFKTGRWGLAGWVHGPHIEWSLHHYRGVQGLGEAWRRHGKCS